MACQNASIYKKSKGIKLVCINSRLPLLLINVYKTISRCLCIGVRVRRSSGHYYGEQMAASEGWLETLPILSLNDKR